MTLNTDKFDDYALKKVIEVNEYFQKISVSTTVFKEPIHIDEMLKQLKLLTPEGPVFSDEYLNRWRKLFTDVDFKSTELLEISTYDFFPEEPQVRIEIVAEIPKLEHMISAICLDNRKLYEIQPTDFEELVAEMLRKEGWEVKLTKKTRDGGYDMLGLQQIGGIEFKMIAEVKRWAQHRKIGVDIIRGFQSVILSQGVNKGIIFTSSSFTKDAKDYRGLHAPHLIDLRDYNDIIGWMENKKV